MRNHPQVRWIQAGVVGGLCASLLYPLLLFAPLPFVAAVTAAALLGPAIGIGSLGLLQLIRVQGESVMATLGAIANVAAGALFAAMVLVQLAVRHLALGAQAEPAMVGIWLGLDVAWDVYIALGTVFLASAMVNHPRFRWVFAVPGLVLGGLVLVLNLLSFPTPPAEAGSVDVGPVLGLWYLAATVQAWRSLGWAREKLGPVL